MHRHKRQISPPAACLFFRLFRQCQSSTDIWKTERILLEEGEKKNARGCTVGLKGKRAARCCLSRGSALSILQRHVMCVLLVHLQSPGIFKRNPLSSFFLVLARRKKSPPSRQKRCRTYLSRQNLIAYIYRNPESTTPSQSYCCPWWSPSRLEKKNIPTPW
jgi:hypothetical protein